MHVIQCAICSSTLNWKAGIQNVCETAHLWEWMHGPEWVSVPFTVSLWIPPLLGSHLVEDCCLCFLWPQSAQVRHDSQLWRSSCQSRFGSSLSTRMMSPKWTAQSGPARLGTGIVTTSVVCMPDWFGDWTNHVSIRCLNLALISVEYH